MYDEIEYITKYVPNSGEISLIKNENLNVYSICNSNIKTASNCKFIICGGAYYINPREYISLILELRYKNPSRTYNTYACVYKNIKYKNPQTLDIRIYWQVSRKYYKLNLDYIITAIREVLPFPREIIDYILSMIQYKQL